MDKRVHPRCKCACLIMSARWVSDSRSKDNYANSGTPFEEVIRLGTYLAIPSSLVSHTGFTVDHNVSVGELDIARRRGSHGPRIVRIGRGFEREVAQHHETGLAGLWKRRKKAVSIWGYVGLELRDKSSIKCEELSGLSRIRPWTKAAILNRSNWTCVVSCIIYLILYVRIIKMD